VINTDIVGVSIDRGQHTVLVVDDNPVTRYSTGRVLRAAGFKTVEAASGQEALDQTKANNISAVVLDVHLPDFDGFEVCRRLRAEPETAVVPVIHLSATYLEDRHKVAGLNSGADAYITHPAEPPILVATVQALVRARMAEEQVRRSEAKFRAIYARAESGIALIDAAGRFVELNPALMKMLGRPDAEVVGRRISEFAAPESEQTLRERTEGESTVNEFGRELLTIRRPDGTDAHVELSLSPYGEPGLRVAIVSNVSDRVALEQQRQQLLEREQAARMMAERHSQTKDDFVAVLSHELRNPLNAMLMGIHVLQRRNISDEVAQGLKMIERNANTQARIIADILDLSRLNSGKLMLERSMVDAAGIVRATVDGMQPAFDERRVSVHCDLDSGAGPAWIDATRFQQILWNILTNAVKFSYPGGRVVVLLTRDDTLLQLVVRDYGQGIDPAFIGMVFEKFSQGLAPGNLSQGGLGLGMSIVKHLVELHGGTVRAESEGAGTGATFTVALPLTAHRADIPRSDFADSSKRVLDSDIQGLSILVVEDDEQAREMLSLILRERGAHVATASDYATALEAFDAAAPAVLVSDIGLPGRDGYDLVREIRQRESAGTSRRPLCAIALTAFGRPEDKSMAIAAGFDLHMSKPLKAYQLVTAIAQLSSPA